MGNHEYCDECGASDFHHGRPCDPARKAKKDAERAEMHARMQADGQRLQVLLAELRHRGYDVRLDQSLNVMTVRIK